VDRTGKRPGVLVVHGGAGVDDHARDGRGGLPSRALWCCVRRTATA
jgi:hypothetical protein